MRIVYQKIFGPVPAEITVPCFLSSKPRKGELVWVNTMKSLLIASGRVDTISENSYTFKTTSEEK
jgi:hypothetical protein